MHPNLARYLFAVITIPYGAALLFGALRMSVAEKRYAKFPTLIRNVMTQFAPDDAKELRRNLIGGIVLIAFGIVALL